MHSDSVTKPGDPAAPPAAKGGRNRSSRLCTWQRVLDLTSCRRQHAALSFIVTTAAAFQVAGHAEMPEAHVKSKAHQQSRALQSCTGPRRLRRAARARKQPMAWAGCCSCTRAGLELWSPGTAQRRARSWPSLNQLTAGDFWPPATHTAHQSAWSMDCHQPPGCS
ncbi:hypothetical protein BDV95DRAFT_599223 [Massariosphaeria phaeospora]|uniref:Uncharacterized protein n=1 Tax=Massariosphaeria phaeospora TaxID=100035 RepID=A0A7C8M2G5_9PLEO|nr:hypothetical protein BDV95DRAFT_599223 [Massariosphaeria phaeospora]